MVDVIIVGSKLLESIRIYNKLSPPMIKYNYIKVYNYIGTDIKKSK